MSVQPGIGAPARDAPAGDATNQTEGMTSHDRKTAEKGAAEDLRVGRSGEALQSVASFSSGGSMPGHMFLGSGRPDMFLLPPDKQITVAGSRKAKETRQEEDSEETVHSFARPEPIGVPMGEGTVLSSAEQTQKKQELEKKLVAEVCHQGQSSVCLTWSFFG